MPTPREDLPSTPCPAYILAAPDLKLIRDLLAGTRRMHEQAKAYIPKWSAEKDANYKKRSTSAKVYGMLERSLSAAVGMLFAQEPKQEGTDWTPDEQRHWENIDMQGAAFPIFAKRHSEDAIADGFAAILVDHPPAPAGVTVTAENEQALNLRPKWAAYKREDIISWITGTVENVETLLQVVLVESVQKKTGIYGAISVPRYRVCRLNLTPAMPGQSVGRAASWELFEEQRDARGNVTVVSVDKGDFRDRAGMAFTEIPLAISYGGRTDAILTAHPPLLALAYCNLEHWRVATDLRYYEQLCAFPQPTIEGDLAPDENGKTPPFQMGPGVLIRLTAGAGGAAGGKFYFVELEGKSLEQLRASLEEKKDEGGELGASFLAKKTRGVETAESKRIDSVAENATLATAADGIEDGLNQAWVYHARYLGIPAEQAPTVLLNRDFEQLILDAATMVAYVQACRDVGLPVRVLLQVWKDGGRIPANTDLDELELEMLANAAAAEQQRKQAAEDAARNAGRQPPVPA